MASFSNKRSLIYGLFFLILFSPGLSFSEDGFKRITLPVFSDFFSLNKASWSTYLGYDQSKKEFFHLKIVVKPQRKGQNVTIFAEKEKKYLPKRTWAITYEIKNGLPRVVKGVIFRFGKEVPVILPEGLLKDGDKPIEFRKEDGFRLLKRVNGKYRDKKLDLSWFIKKGKGRRKNKAVLSHEVRPLGIVIFEGDDISLYLENWGESFKSPIEGRPIGLKKWLSIKGQ